MFVCHYFNISVIRNTAGETLLLPASFTRAMEDLESEKKLYSCVPLSFSSYSLATLLPLSISFFFHFQSAPGPASGKVPLISKKLFPSLCPGQWLLGSIFWTFLLPSEDCSCSPILFPPACLASCLSSYAHILS